MSVAATTQIIEQGPRNLIMNLSGLGDGNGNENKVIKVDVSALSPPCSRVKIMRMNGVIEYGVVDLYWDALVPLKFASLTGQVDLDYTFGGGLNNPKPNGWTGDVLLSTDAFELNSAYTLRIEMVKKT